MAIAELYSGQETALSTTEWDLPTDTSSLSAITTDGVYQVFLDVSDMVAGDVLRIRLYEKCRSGDTQRIAEEWTLSGTQSKPIWVSPSVILIHGWTFTITATAGTISVNWSVRQVA